MQKLLRGIGLFASIGLSGCAHHSMLNEPVILGVSSPMSEVTIENKQESVGTSKLNVFSCSHGITLLDNEDLAPSPLQFVDRYVKTELKTGDKQVSLNRFDVYFNRQLPSWKNKTAAFSAGLGFLGEAISEDMRAKAMDEGDDVVGCKGEDNGEFSVFELGESPDFESTPIVTHIAITIDGKTYQGRGFKDTYSLSDLLYYVKDDVRKSVLLALDDIKLQMQQEQG
ncbi:hypothetical protein [Corallincola spongiicola]|uniref:ABC-type transport auxiliary lipoprotein component domain-containing protein n=1 Tax=Corallincola spongiicola TaxID=2520508 RepID=A0ABY1WLF7_9GAMM|nr:hypothetical protein [Corallincola spongiicola]TAA41755.1 hypothetical protein EXY25_16065 [Corallincola spongiicola]